MTSYRPPLKIEDYRNPNGSMPVDGASRYIEDRLRIPSYAIGHWTQQPYWRGWWAYTGSSLWLHIESQAWRRLRPDEFPMKGDVYEVTGLTRCGQDEHTRHGMDKENTPYGMYQSDWESPLGYITSPIFRRDFSNVLRFDTSSTITEHLWRVYAQHEYAWCMLGTQQATYVAKERHPTDSTRQGLHIYEQRNKALQACTEHLQQIRDHYTLFYPL